MKGIVCFVILVAAVAAVTAGGQAAAPDKIGVFDAQRVSVETAEGKRIQIRLNAFGEKKRAELAAKEKDLQDLRDRLNAQALSLSPERRTDLEKDIKKKELEVDQANEGARREWDLEINQAESRFQEKLAATVESFGREEGFALILDRRVAAYVHPSRDVTTAIVDRFDKMFPVPQEAPAAKEEGKAPAAPPAAPPASPDKKK